jgi:methionyl aminopeptidase
MFEKTGKPGRNDPCFCGSGKKYKRCCLGKESAASKTSQESGGSTVKKDYFDRYRIRLKEKNDIEGIRKAGRLVLKTLDLAEEAIRPGIQTDEIDRLVHDFTQNNGAVPATLGYRGYPKSVCVSVNEVICHGIPGNRVLHDGDIVNVDVTSILNGYFADASKTFFVGTPGTDARKIVRVAKECLMRGMAAVRPGNCIGDIGWAIQTHAGKHGCSVVREFVGHGVGFEFHEPPHVPHFGRKNDGVKLVPGMVFTVEPMVNLGKRDLYVLEDGWTAVTKDRSLSAQFEQTVLVTETGFESLTPYT